MDKWLEEQILKISNRNEQKVLNLRHQIHQDPELSFKEFHTSERVKKILEDMGLKVHSGIAGTGLVADIVGEKPCDNPKSRKGIHNGENIFDVKCIETGCMVIAEFIFERGDVC